MCSDIRDAMESYDNSASLWFGKYKDTPIKEVPIDYLLWIKSNADIYSKFSKS